MTLLCGSLQNSQLAQLSTVWLLSIEHVARLDKCLESMPQFQTVFRLFYGTVDAALKCFGNFYCSFCFVFMILNHVYKLSQMV